MPSVSTSPEISVVIPALNEGAYLRRTVVSFQHTLPVGSEIIAVDDGSQDGSTESLPDEASVQLLRSSVLLLHTGGIGCAGARNYGAARATGRYLVFADAHLELPAGWAQPITALLERPQVGAAGPAICVMGQLESKGYGLRVRGPDLSTAWLRQAGRSPYPVPFLGSAFLAMRREVFQACGGFDAGLLRWGCNDLELGLRLWRSGYECWLAPQVEVAHLFRRKHPYQVDWVQVLHNLLRVALVHFGQERLGRVIEALKSRPQFAAALALVSQGDGWQRRQELAARGGRDDNWFFDAFGIVC